MVKWSNVINTVSDSSQKNTTRCWGAFMRVSSVWAKITLYPKRWFLYINHHPVMDLALLLFLAESTYCNIYVSKRSRLCRCMVRCSVYTDMCVFLYCILSCWAGGLPGGMNPLNRCVSVPMGGRTYCLFFTVTYILSQLPDLYHSIADKPAIRGDTSTMSSALKARYPIIGQYTVDIEKSKNM